MFSVETEQEAKDLIVLACPCGGDGDYYAEELASEQTLENLVAFSDRLQKSWDLLRAHRLGKR